MLKSAEAAAEVRVDPKAASPVCRVHEVDGVEDSTTKLHEDDEVDCNQLKTTKPMSSRELVGPKRPFLDHAIGNQYLTTKCVITSASRTATEVDEVD